MSKTVTLNLSDENYALLQAHAQADNRSLENLIETAALRYLIEYEYIDDFEMEAIENDQELQENLKSALEDAKMGRGYFVES